MRLSFDAGGRRIDIDIAGVTADSRAVEPGYLFAALPGTKADGARFAADAVARGAVAILAGEGAELTLPQPVPVLRDADPRRRLALIAADLHGRQPQTIVAVTGTSGKTSVADFTRQIFAALGMKAASLGTIGVVKPDGAVYGSLTTPDPVELMASLAGLAREGITHLAMEASSHGLDQRRLDGVRLAAGAYTNLGHDHLDYHPTVEDYLAAKIRLFDTLLEPGQPAIVNADGARAADVVRAARRRGLKVMTTGEAGETLRLMAIARDGFGQNLEIAADGRAFDLRLPLLGGYQASNALLAAGLAVATGATAEDAVGAIASLKGVKGRLEIVGEARGGIVVVDYAHKPDALAAALDALRPFATGRLVSVFGCGGDRDRLKRPIMGRISAEKADLTIVTDDNPRTETAADIRRAILAAAPDAREIGDREEAIRTAIGQIGKGDVILIAGKGHETGQIVGRETLPFSDHEAAARALAEL
jgi:UDP-N-acetylmuramoyl-L-alanyl-D-glutamate--2,6-diaminopimelate ligase